MPINVLGIKWVVIGINLLQINLKKPIGSSHTFLRNVEAHVFTQYDVLSRKENSYGCQKKGDLLPNLLLIVVIITWPSEKPSKKKTLTSQLSGPLIRSNWLNLFKISSMMSQFSTNKRTISVFCCYLFAVFNNC